VKLFAPGAIRNPKDIQRAITADDYARIVEREFRDAVQRAGASLSWTGSWYAAQIAVDPLGSETADQYLLKRIKRRLHRYRRMGHDLEVQQAHYVPLDIALHVCVKPHYLRGHVEAALLDVLSNHRLADGTLGFFHPDNLTFGEGIYLSKLVAMVQAVTGVESVCVTTFERLGEGDQGERDAGLLPLGPLEVAQLDNDPNFPEHGKLTLALGGGR
jgi:predicted phage baseplate assembly protein